MNEAIALARYQAGEKPMYSTGICGAVTCGYGKLDYNGYWEFPLDVALLTQSENEGTMTSSNNG